MSERKVVLNRMEIDSITPEYMIEMREEVKKDLPIEFQNSITFRIETVYDCGDKYTVLMMVWKDYESDEEYSARLEAEKVQNDREYARYLQLKAKFEQ